MFPEIACPCPHGELTRCCCYASLQARASCTDLVCSPLPHGPHSELEGAPRDVLASVFDIDRVGSHFLWDEADAVRAAASIHKISVHRFPIGAGHLGCHGLGAALNWGDNWWGRLTQRVRFTQDGVFLQFKMGTFEFGLLPSGLAVMPAKLLRLSLPRKSPKTSLNGLPPPPTWVLSSTRTSLLVSPPRVLLISVRSVRV